jgi:hypothetical protein
LFAVDDEVALWLILGGLGVSTAGAAAQVVYLAAVAYLFVDDNTVRRLANGRKRP